MGEFCKKGRPVYIEGRLKTRKWQDKDTGADRYSTDIVADQMQMLGGRDDAGMGGGGSEYNQAPAQQRSQRPAQPRPAAPQASPAANLAAMDDDIDRTSGGEGKSGDERVDLRGRGHI